jgi:hypothetical protein
LRRVVSLTGRLLALATLAAAGSVVSPAGFRAAPYAPAKAAFLDTLRVRAELASRGRRSTLKVGAVVPGYLSARGLPPVPGRITVTDTGLVFHPITGPAVTLPLVGPVRETSGRKWRASSVSLAYMVESRGRPVYVFRVDGGVFETDFPGPLLDVAAHPVRLDSVSATKWVTDQPLVDRRDSVALWRKAREVASGPYADSLYAIFGQPRAAIGLIGPRGRSAGRLGEYIAARDSLAFDPGRMTAHGQLRHTLAHELGHRWQKHAPRQVAMLWWGVPPIRDPKRYGYGNASEHQAEAVAFAIDYLQTTASRRQSPAGSVGLLEHYELLVPGTRTMVRHLAFQPIYRNHPLRALLTTGNVR